MAYQNSEKAKNEAIEWALTHGMALKYSSDAARHPAFTLAPNMIEAKRFDTLKKSVPLFAKLIHAISEDTDFIKRAISPITKGSAFFAALLDMHQKIHSSSSCAKRIPLLIMRSDFMDDELTGPKLVECNAIAAGMAPFGQRIYELHRYLANQWPLPFEKWAHKAEVDLIENHALARLSQGIACAAIDIKNYFSDGGKPTFVMVVQENEDNVYDQHLLEHALQEKGIRTVRRTFRELHEGLSSGENDRLLLKGIGAVDCIYLRAGYQFEDYETTDSIGSACCEALMQTRIMIEKHYVAVNATVAQQLASSKRVQMLLSSSDAHFLTQFGLSLEEAHGVKDLLGEMNCVDEQSISKVLATSANDWVLKNQGEGGGHCVFSDDIIPHLAKLSPDEYQGWSLMKRLYPKPRNETAYVVRKGEIYNIDDLISEIGLFTVHFAGKPMTDEEGYAGYLIRSKSSETTEGGVHSGMGALDSLALVK